MEKFITLKTISPNTRDERNVTLAYSFNHAKEQHEVYLLGNLEHCATLIIDQELVDELQDLVDLQRKEKDAIRNY